MTIWYSSTGTTAIEFDDLVACQRAGAAHLAALGEVKNYRIVGVFTCPAKSTPAKTPAVQTVPQPQDRKINTVRRTSL
jgi:hypothetical protein